MAIPDNRYTTSTASTEPKGKKYYQNSIKEIRLERG